MQEKIQEGKTLAEAVSKLHLTRDDIDKILVYSDRSQNGSLRDVFKAAVAPKNEVSSLMPHFGKGVCWKTITESDLSTTPS